MCQQPVRHDEGQTVECVAHGRADTLQAIERAHRGQNMGRIAALAAASAQQSVVTELHEQGVEEHFLGAASHQSGTELAEHRGIEAGVS